MIVICKNLVPKGYQGVTLFPFIILRSVEDKNNAYLINHERIHLRQQLELLVVFFYIWYILEFIMHYIKSNDVKTAYRSIIFEREAYQYEHNLEYLKNRKYFSFLRNKK
ncbi:hypothetical protein SAMN04488018_101163 [Myroides marinus]|uniref:Peptidase M56 domain-containing protein n=1 Tax=Myroides marinus TaxID=703342 RepID=A0A1H6R837_9FLAO|nr:hypothetical protein [Myroides marinus]SEI49404.1 hypothetical protein SAMN04488018_101163 [Myroides marinus]